MTRWVRGASANRKKPLEASKWTEMMSHDSDTITTVHKKGTTRQPQQQKFKNKSKSKTKNETKSDGHQQNVADELEKLGKDSALIETSSQLVVLQEFVRKDTRREARRLKRREQKRQARVCFVSTLYCSSREQ